MDPLLEIKKKLNPQDARAEGILAVELVLEGKIGGFSLTENFPPIK